MYHLSAWYIYGRIRKDSDLIVGNAVRSVQAGRRALVHGPTRHAATAPVARTLRSLRFASGARRTLARPSGDIRCLQIVCKEFVGDCLRGPWMSGHLPCGDLAHVLLCYVLGLGGHDVVHDLLVRYNEGQLRGDVPESGPVQT